MVLLQNVSNKYTFLKVEPLYVFLIFFSNFFVSALVIVVVFFFFFLVLLVAFALFAGGVGVDVF